MLTRDVDIGILSVCLSVCLSHFDIVSKRLNIIVILSSAYGSPIILVLRISYESPLRERGIQVGYINFAIFD